MLRLALAGAIALVLTSAAFADAPAAPEPAKACYTEQALANDAKAAGMTEVGAVTYRADHTDELIIVQGDSSLIAYMFEKGCVVSIVPVDTVTPGHGA
jgi:hypothetical protein